VFIAMLALQISKEVLATLGIVSEDLKKSTVLLMEDINEYYNVIEKNAQEKQEYYIIPSEELPKLKVITDNYFDFLQKLKDSLTKTDENEYQIDVEYIDDQGNEKISKRTDYQVMDKSNYLDEIFFTSDGYTAKGQEFIDYFKEFNTNVASVLDSIVNRDSRTVQSNYDFKKALTSLSQKFDYPDDDQVINRDGIKEDWLYYNYEKFPLVASLTKITKIQSDIRIVEYQILNALIQKTQQRIIDGDKYTLLDVKGSAYYTNSIADPAVVVGIVDPNAKPNDVELKIDGVELRDSEWNLESGKIKLNKRFSSPGIKKITGWLIFKDNNKVDSLEVNREFFVINKPNQAIVSPVNMQVFYVGLRNEIAVAFPGIADLTSIRVDGGQNGSIVKTGSKYFAAPNAGVETMDVIVSGKANDQVITSLVNFRVEAEPPGKASVVSRSGGIETIFTNTERIPKSSLINGRIQGEKAPGMLYDYSVSIKKFEVTVGNFTTKTVVGNRIRDLAAAQADVESAGPGTAVNFTILEATKQDGDLVTPTTVDKFSVTIK
tara:strand:- start:916 stop:2556 length:1641 start_codon:yes stop_codon:yes gene_type:complete